MALGDYAGEYDPGFDLSAVTIRMGGKAVFTEGVFNLDEEKERFLSEYLKARQIDYRVTGFPQHENSVEIEIDLGKGTASADVTGSDLSHGYVSVNADYRT
jgi:glutamate N-acetyltransferase/amino-acid N-acetyltransferase